MSDAAARLPNLYQLLGLAPLESDPAKIAAAVKRLQKADGNEAAAGAEESQRVQKIANLAQKYLLDPKRKAVYDQQWKAVYQASSAAASFAQAPAQAAATVAFVAPQAWDYRRLDQLLPQGDPQAAFDMASFLRSGGESRDPLAAQADLDKLLALLAGAAGGASDPAASPLPLATGIESRFDPADSHAHSLGLPTGTLDGGLTSASGLARRMRQRKQRALLIGGTALAGGLAGLVLLGIYLFGPESELAEKELAQAKPARPAAVSGSGLPKLDLTAANPTQATPQHAAPIGSGLPKPGEGAMQLEVDAVAAAMTPSAEMPSAATPSAATPSTQVPSADAASTEAPAGGAAAMAKPAAALNDAVPAPSGDTPTVTPAAEPMPAAAPQPATESNPAGAPAAEPVPMAEPELTDGEKLAWRKGMTEAKELIGKQNFAAAEKQLSELSAAAKTSQQRGQLQRLEQVLGFVKDIRQAMADAVAGLGPADTFKAGSSTTVSFVEGDADRIVVRVSGKNRPYALDNLPVQLGLGLVDLKLDVASADSLARKGAYILTHPRGDAAFARGKRMLQEAAAAGAISPELATFFEDDYGLSNSAN